MQYLGKLTGAIAGLATGRLWPALVGLVLGHQFDRGFSSFRGPRGANMRLDRLPESFVASLFQAMGFLAKADGRVTEQEIRAARIVMSRLGLGPRQTRDAIDQFESGKQPDFSLSQTLQRVRRDCSGHPGRRDVFVRLLLEVALSKGALGGRERAALWRICRDLDIGRVELAQLEAMLRAQKTFRRSSAGSADAERVRQAYSMLGVTQNSTNDEIKQAYRRLMNRNHPDKLSGTAADVAAVAAAQKRTREIRGAYDMLRSRRAIR